MSIIDDFENAIADETHPYHELAMDLLLAYAQASQGKGKTRHASGERFNDQPIHTISRLLDSTDGMAFQAIKKIHEAKRLSPEKAIAELHGAIVYVAAMCSQHRDGE